MNSFFATYSNSVISFAEAEELLFVILTPPYKSSYNQVVGRSNTAQSHILALPLGMSCAQ